MESDKFNGGKMTDQKPEELEEKLLKYLARNLRKNELSVSDFVLSYKLPPTEDDEIDNFIKKNWNPETFTKTLQKMISESGKSEVDVYKASHIDRKLYSKIRGNNNHQPKRNTILSFAIGLELSPNNLEKLLNSAGFSFSYRSNTDLIVRFFLIHKNYDFDVINNFLFNKGEQIL